LLVAHGERTDTASLVFAPAITASSDVPHMHQYVTQLS